MVSPTPSTLGIGLESGGGSMMQRSAAVHLAPQIAVVPLAHLGHSAFTLECRFSGAKPTWKFGRRWRLNGGFHNLSLRESNSPRHAIASSVFEPSLRQHRSPLSGNAILRGRDKGAETAPQIQLTDRRDKMRARIPAGAGQFAMNREISVCVRLRGGPGRTRTSNQAVMSR
jgi:hypothetical protein